jgi:subtilisin family serine protease
MTTRRHVWCVVLVGLLLTPLSFAQPATERVLIRGAKPYTELVQAVQASGGRVTHQFQYVDALAAEIPRSALAALTAVAGEGAITKDQIIPNPSPIDTLRGRHLTRVGDERDQAVDAAQPLSAAEVISLATVSPNGYLVNGAIANVSPLHAQGIAGQGVIVAVIDSGIRPMFPHLSLDGSVIGCEDFVGDALGCSNNANNGHGTFTAGMISANVVFTTAPGNPLREAILAECPACFLNPPTNTLLPMLGTAPLASIYAMRVLDLAGGAPSSRVIAAIERAIELRELYDEGDPAGVNIQVVNMSLGGFTLFAGRDLIDQATDLLLQKGIVPVVAAGNAGPATLTNGSPGSAFNALTVGAASLAHNERILRRVQLGPVIGPLYRPFLGTQTAFFSSRGPNADGRRDPEVVANGFASFGQGLGSAPGSISFASGTSASSPSVAGVVALLRQTFPNATARQLRNAVIMSANPNVFADGSGELDRGNGHVDALAAANLLAAGKVPSKTFHHLFTTKLVALNVFLGAHLKVKTGFVHEQISDLKPGQRRDILYYVLPNTTQVTIDLTNVTPALPPNEQNQLFGDDIVLAIHSAKTSAIGEGDYHHFVFTAGGKFVVDNPDTGIMRISVNGDWTNAGNISADVAVSFSWEPTPGATERGKIVEGQTIQVPVTIPPGASEAVFRLEWREDWGNYPTNDIDLILVSPTNQLILDGATLNNPELARVLNPAAGLWQAFINGFEVNTKSDKFELRVEVDGKVIK